MVPGCGCLLPSGFYKYWVKSRIRFKMFWNYVNIMQTVIFAGEIAMDIKLIPYQGESDFAIELIIRFWQAHNQCVPSREVAVMDLSAWTQPGHRLYFISYNDLTVGFLHLGSRGCDPDWLEDIFVLPEFQGRGIGSQAIRLAEDIVREYSPCLYIEIAARNTNALRLYRRIGYDCLNTVTIRKDFQPDKLQTVGQETIAGLEFAVTEYKA